MYNDVWLNGILSNENCSNESAFCSNGANIPGICSNNDNISNGICCNAN